MPIARNLLERVPEQFYAAERTSLPAAGGERAFELWRAVMPPRSGAAA
jgi:hypothetical protein